MADVEIARNEIAGPQVAHLDEDLHFEIEVKFPGWTERVAVLSPARPGAVRGAVEKVLRDLGMTTAPRSAGR